MTRIDPLAGELAPADRLLDVDKLLSAFEELRPDPSNPAQRVAFGTSGHRGCAFDGSFNRDHVLAITQAICEHRARAGLDGPLFLGYDTHAVSKPATDAALEVLAANGVEVRLAPDGQFTPTPAVSHAILSFNRGRDSGLADGIVVTPSHNPPADGGFKYNPASGGPADSSATKAIQDRANALLAANLVGVKRVSLDHALAAPTTRRHDFLGAYVEDLALVVDFDVIRAARLKLGVDPLGGAGVQYWPAIAEQYDIALEILSDAVDPRFSFMTLDWDGKIRMDPSSPYAMRRLVALKDRFDVAVACDTDHDRHGIVAKSVGLMPSNHYLAVMIDHLFRTRTSWRADARIGKTIVSSSMIDRVGMRLDRAVYEVPVGFKWFVDGLFDGSLGFGGEESAGATFLRRDGAVWTTDKDGIAAALLAAEITARAGRDPGECYRALESELGASAFTRIDAPADLARKQKLAKVTPSQLALETLAGDAVVATQTTAPGNGEPIGGIKVSTANGWFAARPSGTEDIVKLYAESFVGDAHLQRIVVEAQRALESLS